MAASRGLSSQCYIIDFLPKRACVREDEDDDSETASDFEICNDINEIEDQSVGSGSTSASEPAGSSMAGISR